MFAISIRSASSTRSKSRMAIRSMTTSTSNRSARNHTRRDQPSAWTQCSTAATAKVVAAERGDLLLDLVDDAGLEVVEVDAGPAPVELLQLAHHRARGEVAGDVREPLHVAGERHLQEDGLEVGRGVDRAPKLVGGSRVAGEGHRPALRLEDVPDRIDRVVHRDGPDAVALAGHRVADGHLLEGDHRVLGGGDHAEVGPDAVVEDVLVHRLNRLGRTVDDDRLLPPTDQDVGHQRHVLHVIEMAVGEEDVVDLQDLVEPQDGGDRAAVHAQLPVDEEAGRAVLGQLSAVAAEDAQLHQVSPNRSFISRNSRYFCILPRSGTTTPSGWSRMMRALAILSSAACTASTERPMRPCSSAALMETSFP